MGLRKSTIRNIIYSAAFGIGVFIAIMLIPSMINYIEWSFEQPLYVFAMTVAFCVFYVLMTLVFLNAYYVKWFDEN